MARITANDLKRWVETKSRDCQARLPELARRLVRASSPTASGVDVPAGDSVVLGGWDGRVDASQGGTNVPFGSSGWEIGSEKGVKGKADEDYEKRSQKPGRSSPWRIYVCLRHPSAWSKKRTWERDCKAKGVWRDVLALDGEELARISQTRMRDLRF